MTTTLLMTSRSKGEIDKCRDIVDYFLWAGETALCTMLLCIDYQKKIFGLNYTSTLFNTWKLDHWDVYLFLSNFICCPSLTRQDVCRFWSPQDLIHCLQQEHCWFLPRLILFSRLYHLIILPFEFWSTSSPCIFDIGFRY